jgi:hypothetical protein
MIEVLELAELKALAIASLDFTTIDDLNAGLKNS